MNHTPWIRKISAYRIVEETWVYCKNGFYWDLEFSHSMNSEISFSMKSCFCTMCYSLVLLKTLFLSLVPFTTVCCISPKKFADDVAKMVLYTDPPEGLPLSEPNIRSTLKPNRRQKSASVCPNRAPLSTRSHIHPRPLQCM